MCVYIYWIEVDRVGLTVVYVVEVKVDQGCERWSDEVVWPCLRWLRLELIEVVWGGGGEPRLLEVVRWERLMLFKVCWCGWGCFRWIEAVRDGLTLVDVVEVIKAVRGGQMRWFDVGWCGWGCRWLRLFKVVEVVRGGQMRWFDSVWCGWGWSWLRLFEVVEVNRSCWCCEVV